AAERAVGRALGDLNPADQLAVGFEHHEGLIGGVDVALRVEAHAVRSAAVGLFFAGKDHLTFRQFAGSFDGVPDDLPQVDVGHQQRLTILRDEHAVGPRQVINHAGYLAVGGDVVDSFDRLIGRVAAVVGIGDVDAAVSIDRQIVGSIERFALVLLREDLDEFPFSVVVGAEQSHLGGVSLGGVDVTVLGAHQAVGAAGVGQ